MFLYERKCTAKCQVRMIKYFALTGKSYIARKYRPQTSKIFEIDYNLFLADENFSNSIFLGNDIRCL